MHPREIPCQEPDIPFSEEPITDDPAEEVIE